LKKSKVKLETDLKELKLYWDAKGDESDTKAQNMLNSIAPELRYCTYTVFITRSTQKLFRRIIEQMNAFGHVPHFKFIASYASEKMQVIDQKFAQMDFPADYQPTFDPRLFPGAKFSASIAEIAQNRTAEKEDAEALAALERLQPQTWMFHVWFIH